MPNVIYFLLFIVVIFLGSIFDYFYAAKELRELNQLICRNTDYLKDKDKQETCHAVLKKTSSWGIFTIREARKLRKSLEKYKEVDPLNF